MLELVHRGGGPSRADLTALTGLNRSTIGALVAELVELGLVQETDPSATNRVGRPSRRVLPDPRPAIIAVNPEIDAVTIALVGLGGQVDHRVRRELDHAPTPEEAAAVVGEVVEELRDGPARERRLVATGLAVPGLVRAEDGMVRWAPHLGWRDVPFARLVESVVELPTVADNDATLGALAERLFGVGRGVEQLVYLNGGASGIGGGVIVNGQPYRGAHGYAGEFGHNRPRLDDPAHRATVGGTLEEEVSRARLLAILGWSTADEPELEAAVLASADPALRAELTRQQIVLGGALGNAINVLGPELVVLGGFLATLLAWDAPALEAAVAARTLPVAWEGTRIRAAALGRDRLLIGAAELAFGRILGDPASFAA
ncbi:ROK family transcriptional regulator [Protaetiibacter mangrovi]|uniref:ROK family transcriptional regulator n=1 Tax=Protaetiibacter mangrovi TaxID=2970926 RepID=A0ABT1ZG15_9MICO|nr:ROK family transcriptional regulator [Protaetiibacter mangrovi]MCS0499625.1 ROK family transcriptional regulator [Protaetiibacter mangrovi]